MTIWLLLLFPLLLAIISGILPSPRRILSLVRWGGLAVAIVSLLPAIQAFIAPLATWEDNLRIDSLSAVHLVIVALVFAITSFFCPIYFDPQCKSGRFDRNMARRFGASWFAFVASMYLVLAASNIGLLWVAMETTTLASALLVCLDFSPTSIRAAWTYLIICSVGIAMALLGTFLLAAEARLVLSDSVSPFLWTEIRAVAHHMRPDAVRLAFIFLLVGYGTKAGLAPMHGWLPDAHSQAPAPVSALLSGVLLNCALYAICRFLPIVNASTGSDGWTLLIPFSLLSIGISALHLLHEKDIKRLLAYCSVEHIGIITLAIGLGAPAIALFHTLSHSLAKTVSFLSAGLITRDRNTLNTERLGGLLRLHPLAATALLASIFTLMAMPPFATFQSELWLVRTAIAKDHTLTIVIFLIFAVIAFYGLARPFFLMIWHPPLTDTQPFPHQRTLIPLFFLPIAILLVLGLWLPETCSSILADASAIIGGTP